MTGNQLSASLCAVLANEELAQRPVHLRRYGSDSNALSDLAHDLATSPTDVLQKLSDKALELCEAESAGISLLEEKNGRQIFRWHAVSGQWAPYLWSTMPRESSPCGTVLDLQAPQLMVRPERHFPGIKQLAPQIDEVLLIPFRVADAMVGTIWVIAHSGARKFDLEDRRLISDLAAFAAHTYERLFPAGTTALEPRATVRHLLILDNNTDFAHAVTQLLRKTGHEVHVTTDAASMLAAARSIQPDVVFVNLDLSDLDEDNMAAQLRREVTPSSRLIAFVASAHDRKTVDLSHGGFDDCIVAPIEPAFLQKLLE